MKGSEGLGSWDFLFPAACSIMEWNKSEDGDRETREQKHGISCGIFHRKIYAAGKTDPESLGASQRLGNKEGCPAEAGRCCPPFAQHGNGLGAGRAETGKQSIGHVQCVYVFVD